MQSELIYVELDRKRTERGRIIETRSHRRGATALVRCVQWRRLRLKEYRKRKGVTLNVGQREQGSSYTVIEQNEPSYG